MHKYTHTYTQYAPRHAHTHGRCERGVWNWKRLPELWQLCADELTQATELRLLCIAPGSLIAVLQTLRTTCSLQCSPWGKCHGSGLYSLYSLSERPECSHYTEHGRFLLGCPPASQTLSWCTRIRNAWPVLRAVESGMLTFSFSPLLPRTLPRHSL